ncbi:MAG TPA: STAS domain-containing protein [Opitutaceae bacterium]|nr:STAS domain-containing protein [Opitutaceae bacterium]
MNILGDGPTLSANSITQLTAGAAQAIRKQVVSALPPWANGLDLDLSAVEQIDDSGIGILRDLRRDLAGRGVTVRIVAVSPVAQEAFEHADLAELPPIVT